MDPNKKKRRRRDRRHRHVRKKLEGTPDRPRLCVFRSNAHIYAQVIDDWNGCTLTSLSTQHQEVRDEVDGGGDVEAAKAVGTLLGRKCLDKGIEKMVFDRSGYKYHGRVKALAEGVREVFSSENKRAF